MKLELSCSIKIECSLLGQLSGWCISHGSTGSGVVAGLRSGALSTLQEAYLVQCAGLWDFTSSLILDGESDTVRRYRRPRYGRLLCTREFESDRASGDRGRREAHPQYSAQHSVCGLGHSLALVWMVWIQRRRDSKQPGGNRLELIRDPAKVRQVRPTVSR